MSDSLYTFNLMLPLLVISISSYLARRFITDSSTITSKASMMSFCMPATARRLICTLSLGLGKVPPADQSVNYECEL